jgi:glycosyltransferase involved in cell wall biosynthesis
MKIRFVLPGLWLGGGPRNVYNLAMHLAKDGHDAVVLVLGASLRASGVSPRPKSTMPDVCVHARVEYPWHPLPYVNQVAHVASRKTQWLIPIEQVTYASSLLASAEPAVYVATAWETVFPVLRVSKMVGQPSMYFVQAYEASWSKLMIHKYFANKTYMYPFIRFTHGAWLKRFLEENYRGRTYYIGMGINHDVFRPAEVIQHKRRIVGIARIDPNKGFHTFVEAIRCLYKMRKDFEVVIIGEKQALHSQEIDFPYKYGGWIAKDQELANLYQGSIFVSTGRHEALPMPPLEAMACAATVVITDTEGAREYTIDNQNCLLAPIGDAKAIASRINEALSNNSLREGLAKNAVSTASRYKWDIVARKFEEMAKKEGIQ